LSEPELLCVDCGEPRLHPMHQAMFGSHGFEPDPADVLKQAIRKDREKLDAELQDLLWHAGTSEAVMQMVREKVLGGVQS
jgi:hypothetical protein